MVIRKIFTLLIIFGFYAVSAWGQNVDDIIKKHIEALGGLEKIEGIKTLKITGTFEGLRHPLAASGHHQNQRVALGPARMAYDLLDHGGQIGGALVEAGIALRPRRRSQPTDAAVVGRNETSPLVVVDAEGSSATWPRISARWRRT